MVENPWFIGKKNICDLRMLLYMSPNAGTYISSCTETVLQVFLHPFPCERRAVEDHLPIQVTKLQYNSINFAKSDVATLGQMFLPSLMLTLAALLILTLKPNTMAGFFSCFQQFSDNNFCVLCSKSKIHEHWINPGSNTSSHTYLYTESTVFCLSNLRDMSSVFTA